MRNSRGSSLTCPFLRGRASSRSLSPFAGFRNEYYILQNYRSKRAWVRLFVPQNQPCRSKTVSGPECRRSEH